MPALHRAMRGGQGGPRAVPEMPSLEPRGPAGTPSWTWHPRAKLPVPEGACERPAPVEGCAHRLPHAGLLTHPARPAPTRPLPRELTPRSGEHVHIPAEGPASLAPSACAQPGRHRAPRMRKPARASAGPSCPASVPRSCARVRRAEEATFGGVLPPPAWAVLPADTAWPGLPSADHRRQSPPGPTGPPTPLPPREQSTEDRGVTLSIGPGRLRGKDRRCSPVWLSLSRSPVTGGKGVLTQSRAFEVLDAGGGRRRGGSREGSSTEKGGGGESSRLGPAQPRSLALRVSGGDVEVWASLV